jgi:hypothetical protein
MRSPEVSALTLGEMRVEIFAVGGQKTLFFIIKQKMKMIQKILWSCVLVCTTLTATAQGGWTRQKKAAFIKLDYSLLSATKYYTPLGNELTTNRFKQSTVQLYTEYGVTDRFTVIGALPLLKLNRFETTETVAGIGDFKLEAKYRLTSNDLPISVSIAPELPTGRKNAFSNNLTIPGDFINLPTGDGELNIHTTLAASKSFGKWYGSAFTAYNFRTKYEGKSFRDLYQAGLEMGVNPITPLWLNVKLRSQWSVGTSKHPDLGFVRGDGTTYTLISAEAFYKISKKFGVSLTGLSGTNLISPFKNIYIAPYFSVGVVYERG